MIAISERSSCLVGDLGHIYGGLRPADHLDDLRFHHEQSLSLAAKLASTAYLGPQPELEFEPQLSKLHSWTEFDVFALAQASHGKPLQLVTLRLLQNTGVVTRLRLPLQPLAAFLAEVEAQYEAQPYHNSVHAADVTQALAVMIASDTWPAHLTDVELLAVIIAAAVHDLGHPGVSNDFHIRTNSTTAQMFDASSVNECLHASLAEQLLKQPANDFTAVLSPSDLNQFFELISKLVVGTDMAHHIDTLTQFQACLDHQGPDLSVWSPEQKQLALQLLVHSADISNPARPLKFCKAWSDRVHQEFFAQGDREHDLGLIVNPIFDREKSCPAVNQAAFIERKMIPCLNVLSGLAPVFVSTVMHYVETSLAHWAAQTPIDETHRREKEHSPGILP